MSAPTREEVRVFFARTEKDYTQCALRLSKAAGANYRKRAAIYRHALAALNDADRLPALQADVARLQAELDAEQRKVSELLDDLRDDRA